MAWLIFLLRMLWHDQYMPLTPLGNAVRCRYGSHQIPPIAGPLLERQDRHSTQSYDHFNEGEATPETKYSRDPYGASQ